MPRVTKSQSSELPGPRLVAKPTRVAASTPASTEQIAQRAYELFLQDGAVHGRDVEHWLRAESELLRTVVPVAVKRVARK